MRKSTLLAFGAVFLAVATGAAFLAVHNRKVAAERARTGTVIIATVNGAPIYQSELVAGLPDDTFNMQVANAKGSKLERLIGTHMVRQFLDAQRVTIPDSDIDAEVAELRRNPPPASCPCCRYSSLDEYLAANYMDMGEMRLAIANNIGFDKYLASQWEKEFPPGEKRDEVVRKEGARIRSAYVKASHIMFKKILNTGEMIPSGRREAQTKADAAWQRLQKGEAFEAVAKDVSEDAMSKADSGELGCIPMDTFGKEFAKAATELGIGEYSKPVESAWGFHIIRHEAMSDSDVADIAGGEYRSVKAQETVAAIRSNAVVKVVGASSPSKAGI
jgi:parvulin-like peptidyl-prolyl isomerase